MKKHNALQSHIILLFRCCHGRPLDVVVMEGKFTLLLNLLLNVEKVCS
jgi:hypothetical protein